MKKNRYNASLFDKVQIKYLFIVALILGIFAILMGGFDNRPNLSVILTVMVMISYFLIGQKIVERELLTNEQFADSNYYLGFLFTLVSLATSLYILSSGSMEGGLLTSLIGQFGISISTTIVGLSLRIYLLSFSPNIGSNIESFNLMIMEKLQMLNDHIGHSIDQTKTFSNVIDDKVELFIEKTLKSVESYNERLVESLDQHSVNNIFEKIYADMDEIHEKQEARVDEIYKNITTYHERYEKLTLESTQAFQKTLKDSEKWISEFNETMGASAGSIANSNSEMRKVIHNFDEFVRGLPKLFAEVNTLFEQSSKTLTADLEENNRKLIESFIEQKDRQNKILMERVLGENQKIIDSFVESGHSQSSAIIERLNNMNEDVMASFIQSRESGNEKIINDIVALNNKVVQSVGARAESANAKVVDAIITSSTKVLSSFVNTQDQKNEQLISKIALENRRLLESMAKTVAGARVAPTAQGSQQQSRPQTKPQTSASEATPAARKRAPQENTIRPTEVRPSNDKMAGHGSVKLPKS